MKVRVAKREAPALLRQLQALDLELDGAFEVQSEPAVSARESVVRVTDYTATSVGNPSDTLGDLVAVALILAVTLLTLPLQLPFLLRENFRQYKHCRTHDLLFVVTWPIVPLPAYRVDTIGALKVYVYPDDHPPPHFHVVTDKYNAKFDIASCQFLGAKGDWVARHERAIKSWHERNTAVVADAWARTRPTANAR